MISKKMKDKVLVFEKDMGKAIKKGYVLSMNTLNEVNAIELLLPQNVSSHQASKIVKFIKSKYQLDACFFIKKHGINVYYEE